MIFDTINRTELKVMTIAARSALRELETIQRKSDEGCKTCLHFVRYHHGTATPNCALAKGAPIPDDVLPTGCPAWQTDPIPF